MRLLFKTNHLDGNHHIWKPGAREGETRHGPALALVALGRDSWELVKGRTCIGRRLYFYAPSGECWNLDAILFFRKSPYPAGHRYGPSWRTFVGRGHSDWYGGYRAVVGWNPALWSVASGQ